VPTISSNICPRPLRAARRCGLLVAVVVVAALAIAPAAGAAGWAVQPAPNPGSVVNELSGVSCPSATACTAAGDDLTGSSWTELPEVWNGTSWQIPFLKRGDPLFSATGSFLFGASCPAATKCELVGNYQSGATLPLALVWDGTLGRVSVSSQPMQVPSGATYTQLNGVSCTSTTACTAVGFFLNATGEQTLAERWDGSSWKIQPTSPGGGALNGVSCTSATSCMAVGTTGLGNLAEAWDGTSWKIVLLGTFNGASSSRLQGVSCTSATACIAVGDTSLSGVYQTLAVAWTGSGWRLLSTFNPSATRNVLSGVSCTSATNCQAVGNWSVRAFDLTMAQTWDGSSWSYQATANPGTFFNVLSGVSCSSATACTAVGAYKSGATTLTLAERFSGGGSPHGFSLTRRGDVLALLHKPRTLELLVFEHGGRESLLGAVALGDRRAGRSQIHWDLRVDGHRLHAGRYSAELVTVLGRGATTSGPSVRFVLTRRGRVRVLSATCSVAAAATNRC
jgi:hypothetical protein